MQIYGKTFRALGLGKLMLGTDTTQNDPHTQCNPFKNPMMIFIEVRKYLKNLFGGLEL